MNFEIDNLISNIICSCTGLLSIDEVAEMLEVSRSTIYRLAREGKLPYFSIGACIRIPENVIETYLRGRFFPKNH